MKTSTLIVLAVLLFANTSFSQATQESPELKEAAELAESVVKLFNQKKFDEAFPPAKRALQIREKLLPPNDPRISESLHYLGELYIVRGDYGEARQTFERLLRIFEERFGPAAVNLAASLDRLAILYDRENNVAKATDMYQRAVGVREKAYGPESIMTAEALFSLAQFYRRQEQFDKALSAYRRTLSIYGRISGVDSSEFEHASNGFTCLAYASSNKALFDELKEIRRRFSPPAPSPEPMEIMNGKALDLVKPDYPLRARDHGLYGKVIVLIEIDEAGKVISASDMCQGPSYLTDAAIKAARKARFSPTQVSGVPVKVKGVVQYDFKRF